MGSMLKKIIALALGLVFVGIAGVVALVTSLHSELPNIITVADYSPLLVSEVFDRNGTKIGEFSGEKRILVPFKEIPRIVIDAFVSAEDSTFFQHSGINYVAIMRAMLANLKAGEKVQGASTITQQVARSLLLLSNEKTYTRKIKEILLAYKMESHLSKEDILYLYLNQIFLGQNAYGVAVASDLYFGKPLKEITLPEAAILAALPKAPSDLSPIRHPQRAKERQHYVLKRLVEEKIISNEEAEKAFATPIKIYMKSNYWELAPHYLIAVRQMLYAKLGEDAVTNHGLRIYTSLDLPKQLEAQKQVQVGLRELDKRQGFRGALENTEDVNAIAEILREVRDNYLDKQTPYKIMAPDGTFPVYPQLNLTGFVRQEKNDTSSPTRLANLADYLKTGEIVKAVVTKVDDEWGVTYVRYAESVGLIDVESMKWARKPDPNVDSRWAEEIKTPSKVLKKGDVIQVKIVNSEFNSTRIQEKLRELKQKAGKKKFELPATLPNFKDYTQLELEQEPVAEAALLAFDQKNGDVISMVGGYNFTNSQLNRALQASRQTGSSFKTIVYTAALDKGYTPATPILDAPIVYEEEQEAMGNDTASETVTKKWKPANHSTRFAGDILFRNALIQSLNVPAVKVVEKVGVDLAADYARRMGIFSPLNMDLTLALGSSSVTLYEMTKMFSQIGRLGKRIKPVIVHKVEDKNGKQILDTVYLDERFATQERPYEEDFENRRTNYLSYKAAVDAGQPYVPSNLATPAGQEPSGDAAKEKSASDSRFPKRNPEKEPPLFFKDADQLIKPETAYVMTTLLQGVVTEEHGTGARARSLGRPVAGKTGTTNQYYDAWFMGFTSDIAAGVWVGFDQEKTLGKGEVGGRAALPIWTEYMKFAHEGIPAHNFNVPENIVYSSIDNETGKLSSSSSKSVVRQAFISGTEPTLLQDESGKDKDEQQEFYKEDLTE